MQRHGPTMHSFISFPSPPQVLKYRSLQQVLFFPPWDRKSAVGAAQPKPPERFHELWGCSYDARVHPTGWNSPEASKCESVDAMIIEANPTGEGLPTSTASTIGGADSAWSTIECLLTINATLSFQVGGAPSIWNEGLSPSMARRTNNQLDVIKIAGDSLTFDPIIGASGGGVHVFDQYISAADEVRSFVVICRNRLCGTRWGGNEAAIELSLQRKLAAGQSRLKWYDGPTQINIQIPTRAWEDAFCRRYGDKRSASCAHLHAQAPDAIPMEKPRMEDMEARDDPESNVLRFGSSSFDPKALTDGEGDNGIFAKIAMKPGERMMFDAATAIEFPYYNYARMWEVAVQTDNEYLEGVMEWLDRYSFGCDGPGGEYSLWVSGASKMTLLNHGCNVTNVRRTMDSNHQKERISWDVAGIRHTRTMCVASVFEKGLKPGDQLLEDYGNMVGLDQKAYDHKDTLLEKWCGVDPKLRMQPAVGKGGRPPPST